MAVFRRSMNKLVCTLKFCPERFSGALPLRNLVTLPIRGPPVLVHPQFLYARDASGNEERDRLALGPLEATNNNTRKGQVYHVKESLFVRRRPVPGLR